MSRGALCWRTAPTRGSSYPTSRDEVATTISVNWSTPVSWEDVRETCRERVPKPSFSGSHQYWPSRSHSGFVADRRVAVRVLGDAEAGEDVPVLVGCPERGAALGVQQLPVEAVDQVEVLQEREDPRPVQPIGVGTRSRPGLVAAA